MPGWLSAWKKFVSFIKYILFIAFLSCFLDCSAQDNYLSGSRQAAMSGCGVSISDLWSVSHNQAGLGFIKGFSAGIYTERRFLLRELSLNSLATVIPAGNGSFGLNLSYYGFSKYHEIKSGLAYGLKLGENISAGIQLDYFSEYVFGATNNSQNITFECGLLSYPFENFAIGMHLFNPFPAKANNNSLAELPSIFRFGSSYSMYSKLLITGEIQKELSEKVFFRGGLEYFAIEPLALRFGVSTGILSYSFGLSYKVKRILAGIAFSNHQVMGLTPDFELSFMF